MAAKQTYIIGGGIIGLSIALYLQSEGRNVTIIERDEPGGACSRGNAGMFAFNEIFPLAHWSTLLRAPSMLFDANSPLSLRWSYLPKLAPWLTRFIFACRPTSFHAGSAALAALNAQAQQDYDPLIERAKAHDLIIRNGFLTVCATERGLRREQQLIGKLAQHGLSAEILNAQETRQLEPALSADIKGAAYFPEGRNTSDPFALAQRFAARFSADGGEIIRAEVSGLTKDGDREWIIETTGGHHQSSEVVIAAGAWSRAVLRMTSTDAPLDTERGYHLMLPSPDIEITRPMTFQERNFIATPMNDGLRLAGTVEFGGLDAPPNYQRAEILHKLATRYLPGIRSSGATRWMGFRPTLPDFKPAIGRLHANPSVFYAFGHQHLGLTQAGVTGRIIADLVMGRDPAIDLAPFDLDRFN
jgi:D-amino-acid dehydrogenase